MKPIELTTKPVGELLAEATRFFIPSYQRGYRWDDEQVEALLKDLCEFEQSPEPKSFYCLQPLVVIRRKSEEQGRQDEWEVVDGQQRLTTIFLILKELAPDPPLFEIHYQRHDAQHPDGLRGLLSSLPAERPVRESPDLHFIRRAEDAIRKWRATPQGSEAAFSSLTKSGGACARFIWYEIEQPVEGGQPDKDKLQAEAIEAFKRLNAGKIRLLDSELIRALFLQTGKLEEKVRQQIALRWDYMERRLRDREFWSFLHPKSEPPPESRIESLFKMIVSLRNPAKETERATFDWFFAQLNGSKDARLREELWQVVEKLFCRFEEWYEDNQLFHFIGLLIQLDEKLPDLFTAALAKKRPKFLQYLKRQIRVRVLEEKTARDGLQKLLNDLSYDHQGMHASIKRVLLCMNLATLDADKTGTVRFSFHAYNKDAWDIEHIRATALRPPQTEKDLTAALDAMREYGKKMRPESNPQMMELLREIPAELGQQSLEALARLYTKLCRRMEGSEDAGPSGRLGNLTLLDAETNRGYGNSPFQVKRSWILKLEQRKKYLLPCTRNVFTKAYSGAPLSLLHWTAADAADYQNAIFQTLETFFAKTWEAQP